MENNKPVEHPEEFGPGEEPVGEITPPRYPDGNYFQLFALACVLAIAAAGGVAGVVYVLHLAWVFAAAVLRGF